MTPFYERLPNVAGVGVERTADVIGAALAVGATAGVLAHAAATGVQQMRARRASRELPLLDASETGHGVVPPPGADPARPDSPEPKSRGSKGADHGTD